MRSVSTRDLEKDRGPEVVNDRNTSVTRVINPKSSESKEKKFYLSYCLGWTNPDPLLLCFLCTSPESRRRPSRTLTAEPRVNKGGPLNHRSGVPQDLRRKVRGREWTEVLGDGITSKVSGSRGFTGYGATHETTVIVGRGSVIGVLQPRA